MGSQIGVNSKAQIPVAVEGRDSHKSHGLGKAPGFQKDAEKF
jgi:hypothetical protein